MLAAVAVLALPSCNSAGEADYQGWVEADFVFVSPDEAGRIETMTVREGDHGGSRARSCSRSTTTCSRPTSTRSKAQVTNAHQTLDRAQTLLKTNAGTQRAFDDAEMTMRTAEARLNSAQTGSRAAASSARWPAPCSRSISARARWSPPGRPVLALLPPDNIKIRFFVPEAKLPQIAMGDTVRVRCDGCTGDLTARVSFISRTAEYTPPVIYSVGGALEARVPDRGAAGRSRSDSASASR